MSAPGGLLSHIDDNNNDNNDELQYKNKDNSANPTDEDMKQPSNNDGIEEEQKQDATSPIQSNGANPNPHIIKIDKPQSIPYGFSDDTSGSSDDENLGDRKYTHQSQPTEEELPPQSGNQSLGRQYSILLNDKSFLNAPDANFPDNYIKTAKYTILTFIPLNLFEQVQLMIHIHSTWQHALCQVILLRNCAISCHHHIPYTLYIHSFVVSPTYIS